VFGEVESNEDTFGFARTLKLRVIEFVDSLGETSLSCISEFFRALLTR